MQTLLHCFELVLHAEQTWGCSMSHLPSYKISNKQLKIIATSNPSPLRKFWNSLIFCIPHWRTNVCYNHCLWVSTKWILWKIRMHYITKKKKMQMTKKKTIHGNTYLLEVEMWAWSLYMGRAFVSHWPDQIAPLLHACTRINQHHKS